MKGWPDVDPEKYNVIIVNHITTTKGKYNRFLNRILDIYILETFEKGQEDCKISLLMTI